MRDEIFRLLDELRVAQEKKLLALGRRIIPELTPDDLLQPNDFDSLEHNPYFRYEEGILHGIQTAEAALRAELKTLRIP